MAGAPRLWWQRISESTTLQELIRILNRRMTPEGDDRPGILLSSNTKKFSERRYLGGSTFVSPPSGTDSDLPGTVGGLVLDVDADREISDNGHTDGQALTQLFDFSGNGNHLYSANITAAGKEPVLEEEDSVNGHASFDCTGSKAARTTGTLLTPTDDCTVFAVVKRTGAHVEHGVWWFFSPIGSVDTFSVGIKESNHVAPGTYDDRLQFYNDYIDGIDTEWCITTSRLTGTTLEQFYNGIQKPIIDGVGGSGIGNSITIGATGAEYFRIGNGLTTGGNGLNGKIARALVYNRSLSATEIAQVSSTLSEKYLGTATVADGAVITTTSGPPDNADGHDGDYAFDPATRLLYGPKAGGVWPSTGYLVGIPDGGSDGQVLTKQSATDLDADWEDCTAVKIIETGGPTVLTIGDIDDGDTLVRSGSTIVGAATSGGSVPAGGTAGQVLTKQSSTDFDTDWETVSSSGSSLPIDAAAIASVGSGDLFSGTSLDGGWSDLQSTGLTSKDRSAAGFLQLKNTGNTGGSDRGIKRSFSPSGDFTVYTKILWSTLSADFQWCGIFIGATNPSDSAGGNRCQFILLRSTTVLVKAAKYAAGVETIVITATSINNASLMKDASRYDTEQPFPAWLRIKRVGSTISFDVSWDGVDWTQLNTTGTIGFTVDTIGLILASNTDTRNIRAVFQYIATTG